MEKPGILEANQTEFTENGAIGFEAWYDGQDRRRRHDGKLTTKDTPNPLHQLKMTRPEQINQSSHPLLWDRWMK